MQTITVTFLGQETGKKMVETGMGESEGAVGQQIGK